jgi:hypothetical protein
MQDKLLRRCGLAGPFSPRGRRWTRQRRGRMRGWRRDARAEDARTLTPHPQPLSRKGRGDARVDFATPSIGPPFT